MKPIILFDYDDTLGGVKMPNGSVQPGAAAYFDCIRRFGDLMQNWGFNRERAITLQHDIDLELAKKHGFADKTRFAQSMVSAFRELGGPMVLEETVRGVGMSVFTNYPYVLLPGALEVLQRTRQWYSLVIVTKGEEVEQTKKLVATGILPLVDKVFIVGKKDEKDWDTVLDSIWDHAPSASWAIGNSAKADVNPLIRRGYNGIHIADKNAWAYEQEKLEAGSGVCKAVSDIREVLTIMPFISGDAPIEVIKHGN